MKSFPISLLALWLFWMPVSGWGQDINLRAWHAAGQTWLVWEETAEVPATFVIYRSSEAITHVAEAEKIGRVFQEDWQGKRMKQVVPTATFRVPTDDAGGTYKLTSREALFVYTPHEAVPEYFAVLKQGEAVVASGNTVGPVQQTVAPVQCHPQLSATLNGHPFTIYALWVDGLGGFEAGRPDFPVMANEHGNGVGHFFSVSDPIEGRPEGGAKMPAVINLHGGTGHFIQWFPGRWGDGETIEKTLSGGLTIAMDDCVWMRNLRGQVIDMNTQWFGYWNEYNRFQLPSLGVYPPETAVVHHYTLRRMEFIVEWLLAHEAIDPERLSVLGHSMGGMGVSFFTRYRPDLFNCGTAFGYSGCDMGGNPLNPYMRGTRVQNLATTLDVGMMDFFNPATQIANHANAPLLRYVMGKGEAGWYNVAKTPISVPMRMQEINEKRIGATYYWDERPHEVVAWEVGQDQWEAGADHWVMSPRLSATDMSRFRRSQSYPAFSNDDYAPAPGRQPDPGDGPPETGDPWGVWGGGYMDWDLASLVDTSATWRATLSLVRRSAFANDIPDTDSAVTDLTVRRPQAFKPPAGERLAWTLTGVTDQTVRQSGEVVVDEAGLVTISGLTLSKDPARLQIFAGEIDTDGDGILDRLDPDDDNDGISDLAEAIAGTHPLDATSRFDTTSAWVPGEGFRLTWNAVEGRVYSIFYTPTLLEPFQLLTDGLIFPHHSWTDATHEDDPAAFFKIESRVAP